MLRNILFAATVIATAAVCVAALLAPRPAPARASNAASPASPPLQLELGLLAQRETDVGDWCQIPARRPLRRGDELQLTIKPHQAGHLMVAFSAGTRSFQIVYPLAGQTGEVRTGWAYALPDPGRGFPLDGEPSRLVIVLSHDPLPATRVGRVAVLRAALRRPVAASEPAPPARLELRDGAPARVAITRYSASQPLVVTRDF
jgi:hypothetical protein